MINDDTVLEPIKWQQYDSSGKSHKSANEKMNAICKYIFTDYSDTYWYELDGIVINKKTDGCSFTGIKLEFLDHFNRKTQWRIIKFCGTLKDFKIKVLEKFEMLKKLKNESDTKYAIRKEEEKKNEKEINAIKALLMKKMHGYAFAVEKTGFETYKLTLIRDYTKQELFNYLNNLVNNS